MQLPFTSEDFMQVFESYNTTVFPMQVLLNLLAVLVIVLSVKKIKISNKAIGYTLAFLWLWVGIVYHLLFFSRINPAARFFAILFILQGIIFLISTVRNEQLNFKASMDPKGITGAILVLYALIIYPLLG